MYLQARIYVHLAFTYTLLHNWSQSSCCRHVRRNADIFDTRATVKFISMSTPQSSNHSVSAAVEAQAAGQETSETLLSFPRAGGTLGPSQAGNTSAMGTERRRGYSRKALFGKILMHRLSSSKPIERIRTSSIASSRQSLTRRDEAGGEIEWEQANLLGQRTTFGPGQLQRMRYDSAPEVWRMGSDSSSSSLRGGRLQRIFQRGSPSLSISRLPSAANLPLLRKGKRKASESLVACDRSTPSLLAFSRPAPSSFHSVSEQVLEADRSEPRTMSGPSSCADKLQYTTVPLRKPMLLQQHQHSRPLAASSCALAAGAISDPSKAMSTAGGDLFNLMLHRELQIYIFALVAEMAADEHEHSTSVSPNRKGQPFDARAKALAQLIPVCRIWASLVLDGQLWREIDFSSSSFDGVSHQSLIRLASAAGPFVKQLNLHQVANLPSQVFLTLIQANMPCPQQRFGSDLSSGATLSSIDISGCHDLPEDALIRGLRCCLSLRALKAAHVSGFTDGVLYAGARAMAHLEEVDVSGNLGVSGMGIEVLAKAAKGLTTLRLCGTRGINREVLATLAFACPDLEVLDLSYCKGVDDDAIASFLTTAVEPARIPQAPKSFSLLPSHRTFKDPFASIEGQRRVTRLCSLSLTGCRRLTDRSCALLASAVPNLEIFQLAGVGPQLKDPGLIALLETTPLLRRLDIEGASEVTDDVLDAIIFANEPGEPSLTHLIVSHAIQLSAEAILKLISRCPGLIHLQVDDTKANNEVARAFTERMLANGHADSFLSMVDCRSLTKSTILGLAASGQIRPRSGKLGYRYRHFRYDDVDGPASDNTPATLHELDRARVTMKSFWGWQAVDSRTLAMSKVRNRRHAWSRSAGTDGDEAGGSSSRIGRFAAVLLAAGEDADNAAGCAIM